MSGNSMQTTRTHVITIILAFAAIYIIWGTTYFGIRVAVETIPPFFMAGVRFLFSGMLIFIILRVRGVPVPKRFHWRSAVFIGALLLVGGNGLVTWSEQQVPSSTAALVVATVPLWIALFDWLIFKGKRPGKRVTIGLTLGLLGIGLLIGPGQILGTASFSLTALLILLLAPILWSLGSLYSRQADLPENTFMTTAMEMLAGGALLMVAGLVTGEAARLNVAEFSTRSLVAMAYLTIFGSILAFTAYVWLLKHVPATKVATYTYVNPVFAVFLGWLILSEAITAMTIVAAIIIILAVILITTGGQGKVPARRKTNEQARTPALPSRFVAEAPKSDSVAL
ncbi:MAG: drug/metabolite exporter YedA [Chloroflexi bacterium]|nr:drug/metabolite exporter YedA [Chloroflexota bacterium]